MPTFRNGNKTIDTKILKMLSNSEMFPTIVLNAVALMHTLIRIQSGIIIYFNQVRYIKRKTSLSTNCLFFVDAYIRRRRLPYYSEREREDALKLHHILIKYTFVCRLISSNIPT